MKNKELDVLLDSWIAEKRAKNRAVQIRDSQIKALELAQLFGVDFATKFKASHRWAQGFMKRNTLGLRRTTSVGQPTPPEHLAKIETFRAYVRSESLFIPPFNIGNMDETSVPFDMVSKRTIARKGSDCVKIDSTGHEKSNFTVVLCVMASGEKLPPLIIFEKKLIPKRAFPKGVVVKVNKKGWMNETLMIEWLIVCKARDQEALDARGDSRWNHQIRSALRFDRQQSLQG